MPIGAMPAKAKCENCHCDGIKDHIQVCESKTCGPKWSRDIMSELERSLGIQAGEENNTARLEYRGCLGYCEEANNVAVNGNILSNVIPSEAVARVEEARKLPPGDYTKGEFKNLNLDDDAFLGL